MTPRHIDPRNCSRCGKPLGTDEWGTLVALDDLEHSPSWGPAVCSVSVRDGISYLALHEIDDERVVHDSSATGTSGP
jgi:hypothetical protein